MSFLVRRLTRLPSSHTRIPKRNNTTSTSANAYSPNPTNVPPIFTQKPPIWVRFAWPIIIANALLMGSAMDITWSHWATLVKDLEGIAEKNNQVTNPTAGQTLPTNAPDTTAQNKKEQDTYHWEHRPTWQRAAFCGIYAMGWAVSTAYLLKYRQTFVTSLRFFRGPKEIPPTPATVTSKATTKTTVSESIESQPLRLLHISTASNPRGRTLSLNELNIQDGRNETEMVIRMKDASESQQLSSNKARRGKRAYWYLSLTDAVVDGGRYGVEGARERLLTAWSGTGVVERMQRVGGGWRSGPVMRS